MNEIISKIPLEEIEIGMSSSYTQTITDCDIKMFAGVSGDKNPLHIDEVYATESRYKKRIVHGMLLSSFFSALFGTKLPGIGCVYVSQALRFKRAVYIGDTVIATVTVVDINIEKRRVYFKTTCKVKNKIVIDGEAELFVLKEDNETKN